MGGGMGGGMPPPPPPGIGGGGLGGGMGGGLGGPGMGDPSGGQQPIPVKTIDAMDVWNVLKDAMQDMEKFDELSIFYNRKKPKKAEKPVKKKSSLLS